MAEPAPPQKQPLIGKAKPGPEEVLNLVGNEFMKLNRRINLIESRMDGMQDHLDLVDNNLVEKHKSAISEVRDLQAEMRTLQSQMRELSELLKRAAGRMSDFASRDDVKVMERYMKYWSPLAYTTKSEVESMISAAGKGHNGPSQEEVAGMISSEVSKNSGESGISADEVRKIVNEIVLEVGTSVSKKEINSLIKEEVGKVKAPANSSESLTKKEIEEMIGAALEKAPKGGATHDDVKKVVRQHIEDLFGKL